MKSLMTWYASFISNPFFTGDGTVDDEYRFHLDMIKILLMLTVFFKGVDYFMGQPSNLVARYVETTYDGVPIPKKDLLSEKDPRSIKDFAALALRETFNLDSMGEYKSYRNTINRVNSHYYRLTWESLNISKQELNTGFISDGQQSYYLVGQELTAMLVRSGIIRMLRTDQVKFWVETKAEDFEILGTRICDLEFCEFPARQWDLKVKANLLMVRLENLAEVRVLPMEVHVRLVSVSPMISPKHGFMVDRIATKLGG